ncbi:MAG: nuclear transport factor 2 family protein [Pseudomonadota bacterium]
MPLDRTALVDLAVQRYFVACNKGDLETVLATFAPDCRVRFASGEFEYRGAEALEAHFNEFRETFSVIDFHDFESLVDIEKQSIAVRFEVTLVDQQGDTTTMRNCNIFKVNNKGLFSDIVVYNTAPLDEGFAAGNSC